jgi:hypothetical protein
MNGLIVRWFLYKKRFSRAIDMPFLYTSALVGASLTGASVSVSARGAARAGAR